MAALPKIVYGVNRAVNVNFNENDALNVVKDGVNVFHKHKEGVCKTHHTGYHDTYCNNPRRKHLEYAGGKWWIQIDQCSACHAGPDSGGEGTYTDYPPSFSDIWPGNNSTTVTCGNRTSHTPYDYYTYTCGYDEN